jgi:peroxiredoxin
MPVLEQLYRKNKDRGFVVIGANVGQARDVVEAFAEKNGLTYPIFIDPEGKLAKSYGVYGIPTNFIINQEGVIMDIILGGGFVELKSSRRMLIPYIEGTAKPQKG